MKMIKINNRQLVMKFTTKVINMMNLEKWLNCQILKSNSFDYKHQEFF